MGWAARWGLGGGSRSSSPTNNHSDEDNTTTSSSSTTSPKEQQESISTKVPMNNKSVRQASQRCDVCGNPVCPYHKLPALGGHEYFCMCVDCQHDLTQAEHHFKATKMRKSKRGSKLNFIKELLNLFYKLTHSEIRTAPDPFI